MFGGVKEDIGVYILAFRVDDIGDAVEGVGELGLPVVAGSAARKLDSAS